jgi:hypothetical protein
MRPDSTAAAPPEPASRHSGATHALALAGLFAAELALFWSATSRHVAWSFPRWYDQVQYLDEAYNGYDWMRAHGFVAAIGHVLGHVSPQGALHALLALMVFCVTGPSRTAALTVNLLAFLALQAATFLAVRRHVGGYPLAWAAVGLLAVVAGPWSGGGGSATDFRLDWMASCAYGVTLAVAVEAGGFRSARRSALLGAAVGVVMLTRFLSIIYFALAFAVILGWLVSRPQRWGRCARLLLSAACAMVVSGWALWRARHAMYAYYWINHIVGSDRTLRDSHLGLMSSMGTVCSELLLNKVGWPALALGLVAAAALFAAGRWSGRRSEEERADTRGAWAMVLVFFAAPAAVLILHPEKASPPFSIILPPAVWMIVLAWSHLARRAERTAGAAIFGAVALSGVVLFAAGQLRDSQPKELEVEFRDVNALSDYLYYRSEEAGLNHPRVAVTWMVDALSAEVFQLVGRERHQRKLPFVATLPTGLFATTAEIVMARLAESDFVCLVTRAPLNFPYDGQMQAMLPDTRRWCDAHLRHVGDLDTIGFATRVYEAKSLARPLGGMGVDLPKMIESAGIGPAHARAAPPSRPLLLLPSRLLWTTKGELSYTVKAAYSPVKLSAEALPEGLGFDPLSGTLKGSFLTEGARTVTLTAENARGVSRRRMTIQVSDRTWDAEVDAPAAARVGDSLAIGFGAFDAAGMLDFIDITDLTTVTVLGRIEAGDEERRDWQGSYEFTIREPGRHKVLLRFVRYDRGSKDPYTFVDRLCTIEAAP